MAKYVIVPIVEGHGEVKAVPILLRRWLEFRRDRNVDVDLAGPVYAGGKGNITVAHDGENERGIEYYVKIALLRRSDIILVLLDADKECPRALAASLLARARALVPADYPLGVVVAKREYEAWFLAAFPSTRFRRALTELGKKQGFRLTRQSLPQGMDVEALADCKKEVAGLLDLAKYEPMTHQRALTEVLPFTRGMTRRSRSFRKLLKELHELLILARRRGTLAEREQGRRDSKPPGPRP